MRQFLSRTISQPVDFRLVLLVLALAIPMSPVMARPNDADEFPPNPLELKLPDPLLPAATPNRPLTEAERQQLTTAVDALNTQATAQLQAGDRIQAFETWNRELRLRRVLGLLPEVQALGRVGEVAWKENNTPQVRWITERLNTIWTGQKSATAPGSVENRTQLLQALGFSYQQVRSPSSAIEVYQQLLADARQRRDAKNMESSLQALGRLYLDWFDYSKAAETYQELLAGATQRGERPNEINYLTQLAYIHEQAKQPDQAIAYQQRLVNLYQQTKTLDPIPALKIRIADNHQQLDQLVQAEQNYQAAYQLAQPLLQLGYASDALRKLGNLYRANNRPDAALRVYDFLVTIEQQAYNFYGMMNAYDQIGQIQRSLKAYPQARAAFQRGLTLAKQLKYREDYFTSQIQQTTQEAGQ